MRFLPSEIFREIFLPLSQRDKLTCMLVCRHWKTIIEEFALYDTVGFYSKQHLEAFAKKVHDQPEIAKKIETLVVGLRTRNEPLSINLSSLFLSLTNIQSFVLTCRYNVEFILEGGHHYPFHKNIKHMYLTYTNSTFFHSILSRKCPNLKTLYIDFTAVPLDRLKNTPFLTTLELHNFKVTFDKLEVIHNNLMYLQSLLIPYGWFDDMEDEYNDTILPASSLTTLLLNFYAMRPDNFRSRMNILKYLCKKYPALSSLVYKFTVDGNWPPDNDDDDTFRLYKMGWKPFLGQLGPQLKKLVTQHDVYNDQLLQDLDDAGCQVKYLGLSCFPSKLFTDMMTPLNQLHFIQTLELTISWRTVVTRYDWIRQFNVLKKLKLYGKNEEPMHLYSILVNCPPLLDTLSFENISLQLDPHHPNAYHQIKTLSLNRAKLPPEFDAFISHCLPGLSKLKLKYCDLLSKIFHLPTMDLTCFHFTDSFYLGKNNIMVSTLCDDQKRWHSLMGCDFDNIDSIDTRIGSSSPHDLPVSVHPAGIFRIRPEFTLICHSVQNVIFTK